MPTNQPTPVILSDEVMKELETQLAECTTTMFPITATRLRALCATVRAAWAERDKWQRANAEAAREINCAGPVAHRIRILKKEHEAENTALRDQLAELAETLTAIDACKNPKCGHCMALLRTTRRG